MTDQRKWAIKGSDTFGHKNFCIKLSQVDDIIIYTQKVWQ